MFDSLRTATCPYDVRHTVTETAVHATCSFPIFFVILDFQRFKIDGEPLETLVPRAGYAGNLLVNILVGALRFQCSNLLVSRQLYRKPSGDAEGLSNWSHCVHCMSSCASVTGIQNIPKIWIPNNLLGQNHEDLRERNLWLAWMLLMWAYKLTTVRV